MILELVKVTECFYLYGDQGHVHLPFMFIACLRINTPDFTKALSGHPVNVVQAVSSRKFPFIFPKPLLCWFTYGIYGIAISLALDLQTEHTNSISSLLPHSLNVFFFLDLAMALTGSCLKLRSLMLTPSLMVVLQDSLALQYLDAVRTVRILSQAMCIAWSSP